jgi:hypothetical protein
MSQQCFSLNQLPPDKEDWVYSDASKDQERGCIGHLRGDFGDGNEFWNTWWQHQAKLNTEPFRTELDEVVTQLRQMGNPLYSLRTMQDYCRKHGRLFLVETPNYQYYLRCNPTRGDYNFYIYCCDRNAQRETVPSVQRQLNTPAPDFHQTTKHTELER